MINDQLGITGWGEGFQERTNRVVGFVKHCRPASKDTK